MDLQHYLIEPGATLLPGCQSQSLDSDPGDLWPSERTQGFRKRYLDCLGFRALNIPDVQLTLPIPGRNLQRHTQLAARRCEPAQLRLTATAPVGCKYLGGLLGVTGPGTGKPAWCREAQREGLRPREAPALVRSDGVERSEAVRRLVEPWSKGE